MNIFRFFKKEKPAQHLISVTVRIKPYGKPLEMKFYVVESTELLPDAKQRVYNVVKESVTDATIEVKQMPLLNKRDREGLNQIKV